MSSRKKNALASALYAAMAGEKWLCQCGHCNQGTNVCGKCGVDPQTTVNTEDRRDG